MEIRVRDTSESPCLFRPFQPLFDSVEDSRLQPDDLGLLVDRSNLLHVFVVDLNMGGQLLEPLHPNSGVTGQNILQEVLAHQEIFGPNNVRFGDLGDHVGPFKMLPHHHEGADMLVVR